MTGSEKLKLPLSLKMEKLKLLEQKANLLASRDPVKFAEIYLGFTGKHQLDGWQQEFLRSRAQRIALNNSRQSGKSTVTAILALWEAIYIPKSVIVLDSPSLRQSQELMMKFSEFLGMLDESFTNLDSDTVLSVKFNNGSRVIALPGSEKTIRGISAVTLLVLDEAARIPDELYKSVRPMLAISNGRLILLSTPFGQTGFFYDVWENGGNTWQRFKVPATECPRISKEFLDEELRSMGSAFYNQEYMCEFVAAGSTRIRREWLIGKYVDKVPEDTRIVMGVDLAISEKNTADYTAICVMGKDLNGKIYIIDVARARESFRGQQTFIKQYAEKWDPEIIAIEDNAYQKAMPQELLATTSLNVRGIKSIVDKVSRLAPLEARYEAGQVYHLKGLDPDFEVELFGFPIAKHDDMVDAMTKAWAALDEKKRNKISMVVPSKAITGGGYTPTW